MRSQRFPDGRRDAFSFADMTEALPQVASASTQQHNSQSFVFPARSNGGFQHSQPIMIPSANNGRFQYSALPESVAPVYGQPTAPTFSFANTNAMLPQMTWGYNGIPGQNPQTFALPSGNNVGFQYSGSAYAFHQPSTSVPHGYVPSMMQDPIWSEAATFDHSTPVSANSYEKVQVWRPFLPPPSKQIVPITPISETFSCKVFVGGLPSDITGDHIAHHFRPFGPLVVDWPHKDQGGTPKAYIAQLMSTLFGYVAYAEIDVDTDFKYPKGAARVAFYEHNSHVAAVQRGFIDLSLDGMEKKAEIKAYVMDNQPCHECDGAKCNKCAAPYFCIDHSCLQYYCRACWYRIHSQRGKENHKMLQRESVVERRF